MPPTPALTDDRSLLAVLNNGIKRFSDRFSLLDHTENKRLLKAVKLINEDPDIIVNNSPRKKSRRILVELLSISRQVLFLCAIGTTLDAIRRLQSTTYIDAVLTWWRAVVKPESLIRATKFYHNLLPSAQVPAQLSANTPAEPENLGQATEPHHGDQLPEAAYQGEGSLQVLNMSLHSLLGFLKERYTDVPVRIHCPFDVGPLPSVHFGPAEWNVRMEFGLGIMQAIMEHGMENEKTQQLAG